MNDHTLNFSQLLQTFRGGALLREANDQLERIVTAMQDTGGSGQLTVTLPLKLNKAGQIEIVPTIKAKVPERPLPTGFYFPLDGRLTTRDPEQMDIEDMLATRRTGEAAE